MDASVSKFSAYGVPTDVRLIVPAAFAMPPPSGNAVTASARASRETPKRLHGDADTDPSQTSTRNACATRIRATVEALVRGESTTEKFR